MSIEKINRQSMRCDMNVEHDTVPHPFAGMGFVPGWQQCKDRFVANPYLYIGKLC